jgi:hypothetical protein
VSRQELWKICLFTSCTVVCVCPSFAKLLSFIPMAHVQSYLPRLGHGLKQYDVIGVPIVVQLMLCAKSDRTCTIT